MPTSDDVKAPIERLCDVMAQLRDPETGCPWDIKQTFATIAPYTIEEAYEVHDAITRDDMIDLKEELGDLLLQVVYHAQMASEADAFTFDDVAAAITEKMVRRHPHVFGSAEERTRGAEPGFWERLKDEERKAKAAARAEAGIRDDTPPSLLNDVPPALPSLTRAIKLQNKAARVGFDWPSLAPVFDKMREELSELEASVADEGQSRQREEFGDLLFVVANVARHLRIDPEAALAEANAKFTRRFQSIERGLAAEGRSPEDATLEEMDVYWDAAKEQERTGRS